MVFAVGALAGIGFIAAISLDNISRSLRRIAEAMEKKNG